MRWTTPPGIPTSSTGWPRTWPSTAIDRKSTRLNSSHGYISYAVFCLKKKKKKEWKRLGQESNRCNHVLTQYGPCQAAIENSKTTIRKEAAAGSSTSAPEVVGHM